MADDLLALSDRALLDEASELMHRVHGLIRRIEGRIPGLDLVSRLDAETQEEVLARGLSYLSCGAEDIAALERVLARPESPTKKRYRIHLERSGLCKADYEIAADDDAEATRIANDYANIPEDTKWDTVNLHDDIEVTEIEEI